MIVLLKNNYGLKIAGTFLTTMDGYKGDGL